MATIVNERDKLLQTAAPRDTDPTRGKSLILSSDTPVFHVTNAGVASPSAVTITASAINIPGNLAWTVISGASSIAVAADTKSATLAYASMTAGSATIRAQVSHQGSTYTAFYVVGKVMDGANGSSGLSTGIAFAYKRSATAPADNPGAFTFTFASNSITIPSGDALANGWTKTIPAGTDPLYVTVASASGSGATDTVAAGEWAAAAMFSQNGLNTATVYLYQRAASVPAVPSQTLTYVFSTGGLTGTLGNWSRAIPSGTSPLYVTTASALSSGASDTIAPGEWATPVVMAQNGLAGGTGTDGRRGTVNTSGTASSWDDDAAEAAIRVATAGLPEEQRQPIARDVVTLTNGSFVQTRFYDGDSWEPLAAYIDGNLLVTGTVAAEDVTAGTFTGQVYRTASSGVRCVINENESNQLRAYDLHGTKIASIGGTGLDAGPGFFRYDSATYPTVSVFALGAMPALRAESFKSGSGLAFWAGAMPGQQAIRAEGYVEVMQTSGTMAALSVVSNSLESTSHALRGVSNRSPGSSGLVGAANGKAFYAELGTMGPFTGAHDAALPNGAEIEPGDIVLDVRCLLRDGWSNTFFEVARSTRPIQAAAIGVYTRNLGPMADYALPPGLMQGSFIDDFGDARGGNADLHNAMSGNYTVAEINALGEGQMNVCGEGGDIQAGDFIVTSSVPGKGMRLDPAMPLTTGILGAIVARAREPASFAAADDIQSIACIYVCG